MSDSNIARPTRPLTRIVDEIAVTQPEAVWATIPNSGDAKDGCTIVTFAHLATAVNYTSHWIESTIGPCKGRETIAYMGINDIRYVIIILATLKTGYTPLLPSPRNTTEGQQSLFRATQCSKIIHSSDLTSLVQGLRSETTKFEQFEIPALGYLLRSQNDGPSYQTKETDNELDQAIIIHTSGSTGLPKPIILRNGMLATVDRARHAETAGRSTMSKKLFDARSILCPLPWFHTMGLIMMLRSIYYQGPLVLPPVGSPMTADLILHVLHAGKPEHGFFPPSVLEDIVETPEGLESLGTLEDIYFAGAPLAREVGNKVAQVTCIQTVIGSTEVFLIDSYVNEDRHDWDCFEWVPYSGGTMAPAPEGLHELIVKRNNNHLQGAFFTFPDIEEWRTKDLFAEKPGKPGLFQYKGRNDDVIVLSNGEKFGPVDFEKTMEGHPFVHGALVVGQARFQAALILELDPVHVKMDADPEHIIDELWPTIEEANKTVPAHGRVWKSKIAIAGREQPFERTPKGSVMRRKTNALYEKQIDALYSNEGFADQLEKLDTSANIETVQALVRNAIHLTLPKVPRDCQDNDDLFAFGADSLQILGLSSALNHAMPHKETVIKPRLIYSNPSIGALSEAVRAAISGEALGSASKSREQLMDEMIHKYTQNLPQPVVRVPRRQKHEVIVTGSTGSLGNYLLEQLITDPSVAKVFCLNRSADARARQEHSFSEREVASDFSKVEFLQVSFGKEHFGLSEQKYRDLQNSVDVLIHNAWAVDFNMGLESFEEVHVSGIRQCIDFSASSRYRPQIIFVSSIASVGNWQGSGNEGPVPEITLKSNATPLPQGYGESKHVSSRILDIAAREAGIPATVVRVGQLAGPVSTEGEWVKQEWLPSLIATSKALGKVPRSLGNMSAVDWVPVDAAAKVLLELGLSRTNSETENKLGVFHLVNPQTMDWETLLPAIQSYFKDTGSTVDVIEYKDWLGELKQLSVTKEEAERVPGLKLLDFYEGLAESHGLPALATDMTTKSSKTLKGLGPVDDGMMKNWLQQWRF